MEKSLFGKSLKPPIPGEGTGGPAPKEPLSEPRAGAIGATKQTTEAEELKKNLHLFLNTNNDDLRKGALYKLKTHEFDQAFTPFLVRLMEDDNFQNYRPDIIELIEKTKDPIAVPSLIATARRHNGNNRNDYQVRCASAAIQAIGEIGDEIAVPFLTEVAQKWSDPEREKAREALQKMGIRI